MGPILTRQAIGGGLQVAIHVLHGGSQFHRSLGLDEKRGEKRCEQGGKAIRDRFAGHGRVPQRYAQRWLVKKLQERDEMVGMANRGALIGRAEGGRVLLTGVKLG
jgi:hypothetical protein